MKHLLKKKIGLVFIIVQFIITAGLIALAAYVDVLPLKYLLAAVLALVFLLLYTFFSQMSKRLYILGRVLSGVFCAAMLLAGGYLVQGYSAINNMAEANVKVDELSAIVLADDAAQTIDDVGDYRFGIVSEIGREYTDSMIESVQADLKRTVEVMEYNDIVSLVDSLYNRSIGVIIFNEAYRETIKEKYKDFDTETRVLGKHQVETVVEVAPEPVPEDEAETGSIKDPIIVYLSGIDVYGSLSKTSRSDVNIIAVINPETAQILLVNTPRDCFVPLPMSGGMGDKLTHAGIYGIDASIGTLEMLYDIDVDYYVRVNFSGLKNIVDALGGVRVYSDYTFTSDWGPSFNKGYNDVNGAEALAFCRERHHFGNGDNQRGINHQHMVAAIFDKATSPKVLARFSKLMKSLEDSFETNMKTKKITKYVKFQMEENPKWNIESVSAAGTGGKTYTYSMPSQRSYVMYPDEASIKEIQGDIQTILDGGKIDNGKKEKAGKKNKAADKSADSEKTSEKRGGE